MPAEETTDFFAGILGFSTLASSDFR